MPRLFMNGTFERVVVSVVVFYTSFASALALFYLAFRLNSLVILAALLVGFVATWVVSSFVSPSTSASGLRSGNKEEKNEDSRISLLTTTNILSAAVVLGDLVLLALLILSRTDAALASPWLVLPFGFFVLFAMTTWSLLLVSFEASRRLFLSLTSLHFFVAFSISAIVYAIGFGFDPFLHRAAEEALAATGAIEPKTILYAGQYTLIAALHLWTGISVHILDVWLLPVLASLTLPILGVIGFERGWGLSRGESQRASIFLLTLPFLPLTFTVPYNLTVLYLLWIVLLAPLVRERGYAILLALIALLALFTHPLLGVPAVIFVVYVVGRAQFVSRPRLRMAWDAVSFVAFLSGVPVAMAISNAAKGVPLAATNPLTRLPYFFGLFTDPYQFGAIPWIWNALYQFRFNVPAVLLIVAVIFLFAWIKDARKHAVPYLLATLGILGSIFFLSTLFVYKDVIVFEQSEYPLRLLHALFFLLFPLLAVTMARLLRKINARILLTSAALFLLATLATISLFMSYPQSNIKAQFAGPSVSAADVRAVKWIEDDAKGEPYLVLANQMTSAAAIQTFGFRTYLETDEGPLLWYPIPTGGPLYGFYSDMTYWHPERSVAEGAAQFAHVKRVYFLTYAYWPGFELLSEVARQGADTWYTVPDNAINIYTYVF